MGIAGTPMGGFQWIDAHAAIDAGLTDWTDFVAGLAGRLWRHAGPAFGLAATCRAPVMSAWNAVAASSRPVRLCAQAVLMEMVSGQSMEISLMACALLSSSVARLVARPMYGELAALLPEPAAAGMNAAGR